MAAIMQTLPDRKWYTTQEAQQRGLELIKTQPTGSNWHWVNENNNAVTFNLPTTKEKEEH